MLQCDKVAPYTRLPRATPRATEESGEQDGIGQRGGVPARAQAGIPLRVTRTVLPGAALSGLDGSLPTPSANGVLPARSSLTRLRDKGCAGGLDLSERAAPAKIAAAV